MECTNEYYGPPPSTDDIHEGYVLEKYEIYHKRGLDDLPSRMPRKRVAFNHPPPACSTSPEEIGPNEVRPGTPTHVLLETLVMVLLPLVPSLPLLLGSLLPHLKVM
jgi:hypothetical protein